MFSRLRTTYLWVTFESKGNQRWLKGVNGERYSLMNNHAHGLMRLLSKKYGWMQLDANAYTKVEVLLRLDQELVRHVTPHTRGGGGGG